MDSPCTPEVENREPSRFQPVNRTRTQSFSLGCSLPLPEASTFIKIPDVVLRAVGGAETTSGGGESWGCVEELPEAGDAADCCCAHDTLNATLQTIAVQSAQRAPILSLWNGPRCGRSADRIWVAVFTDRVAPAMVGLGLPMILDDHQHHPDDGGWANHGPDRRSRCSRQPVR